MSYEDEKYYHVYNRGANKDLIFLNSENYRYCIRLLEKYLPHYKISILAYCLMPNHYHFLLRQNVGGSISHFIQTVFNAYTQALNKTADRSGTLFQGRAKGIEIDSDEYAVRLCRYIHYNPVAGRLVRMPEEWEYSDYRSWIGEREGVLTAFELRNGYFGSGVEYKKFMDVYGNDDEIKKFIFDE